MLMAGLTGGIASGKSTVTAIMQKAGAVIIDADVIAHQVVAPGLPAWKAIKSRFGPQVLKPDGAIDRAKLGDLVFNDPGLRKELEGIIHPRVRDKIDDEVTQLRHVSPNVVVIQDIPLLFETGMTEGLDEIIVVYVPAALQIERLIQRDGIEMEAAKARIDAQLSIEEKRRLATIVIDNSGDVDQTRKQTLKVYECLALRVSL